MRRQRSTRTHGLILRDNVWTARLLISDPSFPNVAEVPLSTADRATGEERLLILVGEREGPLPDHCAQLMRSSYLRHRR